MTVFKTYGTLVSYIFFSKVRTCIQLYTTGGMSMKNYCFHSILMLCCVLSFCTFGDVVRTKEITEIEMPPNISFSFPVAVIQCLQR